MVGRAQALHFVQRARRGKALFNFWRFGADARVVRQLGHDLSVIQMGLTVHFSRSDSFAARHAARAPVVRHEPKRVHVLTRL